MELNKKDHLFVGLQFLLFLLYFIDFKTVSFQIPSWLEFLSLCLSILGVAILLVGMLQLNKNLSPFPSPKSHAHLVQTGLYKYVRHPIYTGILIAFLFYGIYSGSFFRILITFMLFILFHFKTRYEEEQLRDRYSEYVNYQKKTGRFFPVFFKKLK